MSLDTISGYTTSYNCIEMVYPFRECIDALLQFCEEVVVVDAGSTDGTLEVLREWSQREPRLNVYVEPVDFGHPRWAIQMDGKLKAKARSYCTCDFCWQTDTDEVVASHDYSRIRLLPEVLREHYERTPVVYLPMIEFWGSFDTVRADFFSWKPRFSKNIPGITHGIPIEYREFDSEGHEYPRPFDSDSCNYIWESSRDSVSMLIPKKVDNYEMSLDKYDSFFYQALDDLPSVQHVSWLQLERKIRHYRAFWPKFHASMYCLESADCAAYNVMFDKPWSEVTDADITDKARELQELGPRSFHTKLNRQERGKTLPMRRPVADALRAWAENLA